MQLLHSKGTNQTIKTGIMVKRLQGYAARKDCKTNITYHFFVDNLKLCNSTINRIKNNSDLLLDFPKILA